MLTLTWGAATDVGCVRELNQDNLWASGRLFAVADGMGGHAAGEVASELAVAELSGLAELSPLRPEDITAAITSANERIVRGGLERRDRFGMGTTITGLAVVSNGEGEKLAVFNVGDSRVYRFTGGTLVQVTVDHSAVEEMVAAGHIAREQARHHPRRNVVTRSLGSYPAPDADVWVLDPVVGDRFLICSDGLTGELDDPEIAQVLATEQDPQAAADRLVSQARQAGGADNITTIVVALASAG